MVEKKTNFLLVAVAVVALVALILGAVALNKANMTGNAFWDFFKKAESTQENVQEGSQGSDMSNYILIYDEEGNKAFEYKGGEIIFYNSEIVEEESIQPGLSLANFSGNMSNASQICDFCWYAWEGCVGQCTIYDEECIAACRAARTVCLLMNGCSTTRHIYFNFD